jgi:hypothetical protein
MVPWVFPGDKAAALSIIKPFISMLIEGQVGSLEFQ